MELTRRDLSTVIKRGWSWIANSSVSIASFICCRRRSKSLVKRSLLEGRKARPHLPSEHSSRSKKHNAAVTRSNAVMVAALVVAFEASTAHQTVPVVAAAASSDVEEMTTVVASTSSNVPMIQAKGERGDREAISGG